MAWICIALVVVSLAVSAFLCAWLVRASAWWGLIDEPGSEAHKGPDRGVPNTGGVAIVVAVGLPMVTFLVAAWWLPLAWWQPRFGVLLEHLAGLRQMTPVAGAVLAAAVGIHVLGLVDDRRSLGPLFKLAVQLVLATVLVLVCDIRILHVLDKYGGGAYGLSVLLSVVWIVTIINAFNLLDNMDGLAGGVAAIIAALYLVAALVGGQWFVAALAALVLGAVLGFLTLNFPPAKIFMGDGGALLVGLLLAVVSIRITYFKSADPSFGHWYGVLMPLMVMAIPLYDLCSVVLIRLLGGRSPFRGDQNHFSHRLVRRGLTPQRAVWLIWLCTVATGLSGVMIGSLASWQALVAAGQTAAVLVLLAVMETGT